MQWIDVKQYLPGNDKWKIVRVVNKIDDDFYFMAYFDLGWEIFEDSKNYAKTMTITHWCEPDPVE